MKKIQTVSLLLAALLLSAAASSCAEGTGDTQNSESLHVETLPGETESLITSGVPADLDLGGETIHIWYTTKAASVAETFVDIAGNMNGDTLDEAIFNANAAVEEKLGVDLDFFSADSTTSETGDVFNKMMLANDTTYDLWHLVQWNASKFAAEGMYYNMYGAPYVSYGQPWWDYAYMKEMTIGSEKIFMLSGDFAVDRTRCLGCVYYKQGAVRKLFRECGRSVSGGSRSQVDL